VQIKIVGDLAQAIQVSGVSVQVSALTFVLLTPDTRHLKPDLRIPMEGNK